MSEDLGMVFGKDKSQWKFITDRETKSEGQERSIYYGKFDGGREIEDGKINDMVLAQFSWEGGNDWNQKNQQIQHYNYKKLG